MGLDTILVVFTILSGIVAIIDLVKYAIALVRWIVKMIYNEKKVSRLLHQWYLMRQMMLTWVELEL